MNVKFVPFMSKFYSVLTLLLLISFLGSCTRNDAQREFEKEAYALPQNYTKTNNQGEVLEVDEDDWRTSPLYQGLIEIEPPFPNPTTTNQSVQFDVYVTGVNSVDGIQVWFFYDNLDGNNRDRIILYENFETLQPGLTTFQINPIEFAEFGNVEGARGLNRVYIFSGNQQMISYGDIMVE